MPIPKAPLGEEFAYYFQYAVFVKNPDNRDFFMDTYRYEPVHTPLYTGEDTYVSLEDLRRMYAPYLTVEEQAGEVTLTYGTPLLPTKTWTVKEEQTRRDEGMLRIPVAQVMRDGFGKECYNNAHFTVVAIDGSRKVQDVFTFQNWRQYDNLLNGCERGEQNYICWYEPANRMIPYRMYIPFSYDPALPQKTIVCFHGGDANADYMFKHTDHEIEIYAENRGYILLALCSYRKFTFFGGSRVPTGNEVFDPADDNPCGLTEEQLETCQIAEDSVLVQIADASGRYHLDLSRMYALGNSGGSLGIFRQVSVMDKPYFRAVVCSGGMPSVKALNAEKLRTKGTHFLILMSSEDHFDGKYSYQCGYPWMRENRIAVSFQAVGGGSHLLGWTRALDKIFDFFDQN